ncbi:autophagy-related protein 101 [Hydra vulgaris]|nr:autophagy-related protein 101-like [Hydra vulgaris]
MNARSLTFEFTTELNQIEEVVCSIFHTLLFHRTTGKFHYQEEGSYTIGTIGFTDVDCQYIDLTYVRCSSEQLDKNIQLQARQFKELLRTMDGLKSGQISLEFYQRRKNPWPFPTEAVPWELWILKFSVLSLNNESDRNKLREKLTDNVCEKIKSICEIVNQPEYIPKMPNESDLSFVFDDQLSDIQPYLHRIVFQRSEYTPEMTVGGTMRKIFKDTFSY